MWFVWTLQVSSLEEVRHGRLAAGSDLCDRLGLASAFSAEQCVSRAGTSNNLPSTSIPLSPRPLRSRLVPTALPGLQGPLERTQVLLLLLLLCRFPSLRRVA